MNKKIIIVGPGGSGKDYFSNFLINKGFTKTKDYTTRPKRNKKDNDYIFVDEIDLDECYFVFKVNGKEWYYGYSKEQILNKDFCIRPPETILSTVNFLRDKGHEVYIVYFDIDFNVRRERLNKRKDADADRRLKTDREDFEDFVILYNPDLVIREPYFDCEEILKRIIKDIEHEN